MLSTGPQVRHRKINLKRLMLYNYKADITAVYDGDTVTVDFDLGFGIKMHRQKIRLYGINAPEMRGKEKVAGKASRDALRELILGKEVTIQTFRDKKGKYGRWLGVISTTDGIDVNKWLVDEGHAVIADY